jgi:hypothetical protein
MTWFKIDDSFYDHPKVFDAPDCAIALWTRAGTWSARNLTDGFVPAGMPARFCNDVDQAVRELLNRGLWLRSKGGYQFHDWIVYQPTAEGVRLMREKKAEAGRIGGLASGKARSTTASTRQAGASGGASRLVEPPTRPVPKSKNKNSSSTATPSTERPRVTPGSDDDKQFARFWDAYPRRIGKGQARKAWAKAVKTTDPETIIEAASRFTVLRGNEDPQFTAYPATWLNGERWTDTADPPPPAAPGPVMPWELWDE